MWHGRFEGGPAEELLAFTVSLPFDQRLAADDLEGSRAHVRGLMRAGVLTATERDDVLLFEVMVDAIDRKWWFEFRRELERRFAQDEILLRSSAVERL